MPNRLIDQRSAYLLQHADNLIDWFPWGDEAFQLAKQENKPILLSIGYASCHWCHVMAQESFSDPQIAELVNEKFVAIKVDRQEHPDVDAVYMHATQALTGAGGWPLTAFLTPAGLPFFTGTYFPPKPDAGRPSFKQLCETIAQTWADRGAEVLQSAEQIAQQLVIEDEVGQRPEIWPLMEKIAKDFDLINGGWGSAPKFPPANLVDALLVKGDKNSLDMAQLTLEAMARGGICDQIGGGFHRYSVDAGWTIPHFEKMLYDNALLLGAYVRTWRRTAEHDEAKRELFKHTIYGIVSWLNRELRTEDGVFASGLDADSCDIRGSVHEGIFYLWNHDLLIDALGVADANWASHTFHVTKTGTFEDGLSTLQLRGRIDYPKLAEISEKLLAERENRFRPATDELVVTAWNGWLIESLVWAAEIFNEPSWLEMATKAAEQLWQTHWDGNRLVRTSLHGEPGSGGVLEDYAALANGFAVLAGALGKPNWLERAVQLLEVALELFSADDQGFYDGEPGLFIRYRGLTEAVTPSASATMITALRRVALMANRPDFAVRAEEASQTTMAVLAEHPRFAGAILADQLIIDEARRGLVPATVTIITDDLFSDLVRATWRMAPAGTVIMAGPAGTTGFGHNFENRENPGAYICRNQTCFEPVTEYAELKDPLWQRV